MEIEGCTQGNIRQTASGDSDREATSLKPVASWSATERCPKDFQKIVLLKMLYRTCRPLPPFTLPPLRSQGQLHSWRRHRRKAARLGIAWRGTKVVQKPRLGKRRQRRPVERSRNQCGLGLDSAKRHSLNLYHCHKHALNVAVYHGSCFTI